MTIKTLRDIEEGAKNKHKKKIDLLWWSEIILEELTERKRLNKKQIKVIEDKLTKLAYEIWDVEKSK